MDFDIFIQLFIQIQKPDFSQIFKLHKYGIKTLKIDNTLSNNAVINLKVLHDFLLPTY